MTLRHHWRFKNDSTFGVDRVGSADLTAVGSCQSTAASTALFDNARRYAADLPGSGSYLHADDDAATFEGYTEGVMAFWARSDNSGLGNDYLFTATSSKTVNTVDRFLFYIANDKLNLFLRNTAAGAAVYVAASTGTPMADNVWAHIVLSIGPAGIKVYVNGAEHAMTFTTGNAALTSFLSTLSSIAAVRIGDWITGGGVCEGAVDDFYFFDDQDDEATAVALFASTKARYPLFGLLGGQSNGRGSNGPIDATLDATSNLISQVNQSGVLQIAAEQLDHPGASGTDVGPGLSFAKALLALLPSAEGYDEYLSRILVIPAANGSTGFGDSDWNQGDAAYENLKNLAQNAIALNSTYNAGTIALYMQMGENDTVQEAYADNYLTAAIAFCADIRSDLSKPDMPIVWGQLGPFYGGNFPLPVRAAHKALPQHVQRCGYADSGGLTDGGDNVHYDPASAREIGRRAGAAAMAIFRGQGGYEQGLMLNIL